MLSFIVIPMALTALVSANKLNYHPTEGKCEHLKPVANYDLAKYIKDKWYVVKTNYLNPGDKCAWFQLVDRGDKIEVRVKAYNKDNYFREELSNDIIPNGDGTFIAPDNTKGVVLATDYTNYHVYIQCGTGDDGKNRVFAGFCTRDGKVNAAAQAKFDEVKEQLKKIKMLPPLFPVSQDNCSYVV